MKEHTRLSSDKSCFDFHPFSTYNRPVKLGTQLGAKKEAVCNRQNLALKMRKSIF